MGAEAIYDLLAPLGLGFSCHTNCVDRANTDTSQQRKNEALKRLAGG